MESIPKEVFEANVTDQEVELLQTLTEPTLVPTTTREFANLRQLGLVFLQDESGLVALTPLGKAWIRTQDRRRRRES